MTPFARLLPAVYGPDVNDANRGLRVSKNGNPLPNPRNLSTLLNVAGTNTTSSFMSVYVMQMGQFLDHDVTHTPMFPIPISERCCGLIEDRNEQCIPINISSDDPYFSTIMNPHTGLPVDCMRMARSMTSPDLKCSMDIERQQVIF